MDAYVYMFRLSYFTTSTPTTSDIVGIAFRDHTRVVLAHDPPHIPRYLMSPAQPSRHHKLLNPVLYYISHDELSLRVILVLPT